MSHSGVIMGTMSQKCGKYESWWSKCEKEKKRVHVNCNSNCPHTARRGLSQLSLNVTEPLFMTSA